MDKRDTLLLACGTAESRGFLREVFAQSFNLLEADNSRQARLLLQQNHQFIAAVLLDVGTPEKFAEGDLRVDVEENILQVPVIVILPDEDPTRLHHAFQLGATDVIPLNYEPYAMQRRVHNIVELNLHKRHLEELVSEQALQLRQTNDNMVDVLSSIIEYRSVESGQHILRIRRFTRLLLEEVARACPEYHLNDRTIAIIASASALHDVGKISIPDSILNKPGPLTQMEREIMQSHALTGCHILEGLDNLADKEYLRYAHNICHYHHERWDGGGYPEGISGDDIPICAQVVGLADVFDALTSERVYKKAYAFSAAVNMILRGECGVFSPKLLECFKHVSGQFEALARAYADGQSPKAEELDLSLPVPDRTNSFHSMDVTSAKYHALLRYADAFVMELDLDREYAHILYNPYPEMAPLQDATGFDNIRTIFVRRLIAAEDQERIARLLLDGIPAFLEQGLRRQSHPFLLRGSGVQQHTPFELTLLRPRPSDPARQLLLLCRRAAAAAQGHAAALPQALACNSLSDESYCCRNDEYFTLDTGKLAITSLAGYSAQELEERFGNRLLELVVPEDREKLKDSFRRQFETSTEARTEYRVMHKSGQVVWVFNKSHLLMAEDGQEYLFNMALDISASRRPFELLQSQMEQYEIILSQTENVLFQWDVRQDKIDFSDTWEDIFGYTPLKAGLLQRLATESHFHPDDLPLLLDGISAIMGGAAYQVTEVRIATASGRYLWCRFRASALYDAEGQPEKIVGIIINVDDEKRAAQALQDRAERDALTKLLNKQTAQKQAEEYLKAFPQGADCAMLVIDLDNFKYVNDHYGHLFGDAVLAQVAREIRNLFRTQDIVARIGGDEFLVLMRGVSNPALVESRCRRLLEVFQELFARQKYPCPMSCSIGIALSPAHGQNWQDLFQRADQALYQVKNHGKNNLRFYDPADPDFRLPGALTTAITRIDSDEQPALSLSTLTNHAFHQLYTADDLDVAIHDILSTVGQLTNVSRVYIFENDPTDQLCNNTYEWCNTGILPEIHNLQGVNYDEDIPGYRECYNGTDILYSTDIRELPKPVYDILAPQGILSMLHCALRDNGHFFGYMGFDECTEHRMWTQEQIDVLTYLSEILSVFLAKKRREK